MVRDYPIQVLTLILLSVFNVPVFAIPIEANSQVEPPEVGLYQLARNRFIRLDFDSAQSSYENALKVNPKFFPALLGLAEIADQRNDARQALQYLNRAMLIAPSRAEVSIAFGHYYHKYGRYKRAANQFNHAIELNSRSEKAHTELANLYLVRLHQPKKAIEHFQRSIELQPGQLRAYYGLSSAHFVLGQTDFAITTLKQIGQTGRRYRPWQLMGVYSKRVGRYKEAIHYLKKSLRLDISQSATHWVLGEVYQQNGQIESALREFLWIAENTDQSIDAYLKMGLLNQSQQRYEQAILAYLRALEKNAHIPIIYNNLAYSILEIGKDLSAGIKWSKKAVELSPNNPEYLDTLGWLYYSIGEYDNAQKYLRQAVLSKPRLAEANYHLAIVYFELNDKLAAADYFQLSLNIDEGFKHASKVKEFLVQLNL